MAFNRQFLKEHLYSGAISDVLDQMGYPNQTIGPDIMPLTNDTVIFGPAFTSIGTVVYSMPESPLTAQCKVVDQLKEGEVYVLVQRGEKNCAVFGELFATRTITIKKCDGILLDGYARDLKALYAKNVPLFYKGHCPKTSKGRTEINECQTPVIFDGVLIEPGDWIFGDLDGVAVIPKAIVEEVCEKALEIMKSEDEVRDNLLAGVTMEEVYKKKGTI